MQHKSSTIQHNFHFFENIKWRCQLLGHLKPILCQVIYEYVVFVPKFDENDYSFVILIQRITSDRFLYHWLDYFPQF